MQYLLLLFGDEQAWDNASPEQQEAEFALHEQFASRVSELGGEIVGGNELAPSTAAHSIRTDDVTDGPFIESKEVLGAYYVIEAADLDQALAIARHCPSSFGGVELRPIIDHSGE